MLPAALGSYITTPEFQQVTKEPHELTMAQAKSRTSGLLLVLANSTGLEVYGKV